MRLKQLLRLPRPLLAAAAGAALLWMPTSADAAMASGDQVFEETFDRYSVGSVPDRPWTSVLRDGTPNGIEVVRDTRNRFGNGRSNQILEFRKIEAAPSQAWITRNAISAEIAKIVFQIGRASCRQSA